MVNRIEWYYYRTSAPLRRPDDRGDVPGWVMICVMSAGIVGAIGAIAGDELTGMFRDAIHSVTR